MAELHMFPPSGHPRSPEERLSAAETHLYHAWQKIRELEAEHRELKKDREALLRYMLWRLVIFLGLLIGALVSKGSTGGSLVGALLNALTASFGS